MLCPVYITTCFRVVTNEVEEEARLRREMDEDVMELREDHEQSNSQRAEVYETELAEWKAYEKARVSTCLDVFYSLGF